MSSTFTNNLQLELMSAGDQSGTWGDPTLNQNVFARIDAKMGNVTAIALSSTDVTLTQTQWRSNDIQLTGSLSASVNLIIPLNVNSLTVAVGGQLVIDNQCTGNFTVTVKTAASGSTGVVVPQGVKSTVTSDTTNVVFSDDRLGDSNINRSATVAGSPNGVTTGVAGTAYKPMSTIIDRTNRIGYFGPLADGNTGWVPANGYYPNPQGYLTLTSGTAIITGDVTAATAVYYTPYVGNMVPIYDGNWLQAYFFSEQTLTLSSSQAASNLYDVFAFLNSGSAIIGTGPAWTSATAGSCTRGAGAGTTQLSRINGLWTNTVSMTMRNGGLTYSVAANQGTYLGSLFMDGTNGQVSCYRSWGQNRKWGVWNAYNRVPIAMQAGDSTTSWTPATTYPTFAASNGNSANKITSFFGLAEEEIVCNFEQLMNTVNTGHQGYTGIGLNSTTAASGTVGSIFSGGAGTVVVAGMVTARYIVTPSLGINNIQSLDAFTGGAPTASGTQAFMVLDAAWRG